MNRRDHMNALHSDPAFAAARDQRGRDRFKSRNKEMQAKSKAKRRGVNVPPELEGAWQTAKRKKMSNAEAAKFLGLKYKGKPKHGRNRRKRKNGDL